MEIDPESASLYPQDILRLQRIEADLERGQALLRWWRQKNRFWDQALDQERLEEILGSGIHPEIFPLTRQSRKWPLNLNYGFLDEAKIRDSTIPVIGRVQQIFFDQPMIRPIAETLLQGLSLDPAVIEANTRKALTLWRDGLQAFVMEHFPRLSHYQTAEEPFVNENQRPAALYLQTMSLLEKVQSPLSLEKGFGHSQLYYKRRSNGRMGKFRWADRGKIELQNIEPRGPFAWIVLRVRVYETSVFFDPLGKSSPHMVFPVETVRLAILSQEFSCNEISDRFDGDIGHFGLGYALVDDPSGEYPFGPGFQIVRFRVETSGRILAWTAQVRRRPHRITSFALHPLANGLEWMERFARPVREFNRYSPFGTAFDPVRVAIRLANVTTKGWADKALGISVEQLEKRWLARDAAGFSRALDHVSYIWRQVPDWTAKDRLPDWLKT